MNCVITGCSLILDNAWAACDVFEAGDHFVMNANLNKEGTVAWHKMHARRYTKEIDLTGSNYWEKRGVFIVPKDQVELNQAAKEYIA